MRLGPSLLDEVSYRKTPLLELKQNVSKVTEKTPVLQHLFNVVVNFFRTAFALFHTTVCNTPPAELTWVICFFVGVIAVAANKVFKEF